MTTWWTEAMFAKLARCNSAGRANVVAFGHMTSEPRSGERGLYFFL